MEPESPFDPPSQETTARATTTTEPKLGIVHLVIWTACTALALGLLMFTLRRHEAYFHIAPSTAVECLHLILLALYWGAGLAALTMLAARRLRGVPFPRHPGEFLAVLLGASSLVHLIYFATNVMMIERGHDFDRLGYLVLAYSIPLLLITGLLVVWATRTVRERRWRIFFVTLVAESFLLLTLVIFLRLNFLALESIEICMWWAGWLWAPLLLLLAIAIWGDRRTKCRRPWTHWFGIVLQIWDRIL